MANLGLYSLKRQIGPSICYIYKAKNFILNKYCNDSYWYTNFYRKLSNNHEIISSNWETNENKYAHSILLSLPNYCKTAIDSKFLIENEDSLTGNQKKLSTIFYNILKEYDIDAPLSYEEEKDLPEILNKLILNFVKKVPDECLLKLLLNSVSVIATDPSLLNNFITAFKTIRNETLKRMQFWSSNQILVVADIWYALQCTGKYTYLHEAVKILGSRLSNLTPPQIVQFFFYLNIIRENKVTERFEAIINRIIDDITIEELGIVSMGLFKTQTFIQDSQLNEKIIKKTIEHITSISDISLCSVLKMMHLCFEKYDRKNVELCLFLFKEFKPHLKTFNSYILVQLASLGNHYCIYDEEFLQEIYNIIFPIISQIRVKDIERLTFVIMNSRFSPRNYPNYVKLIENELSEKRRSEEIYIYSSSFLSCVYYLACIDCNFSNNLISMALRINDISLAENGVSINGLKKQRELHLCQLDKIALLKKHNYTEGYRLAPHFSKTIIMNHLSPIPFKGMKSMTRQQSYLLLILDLMKELDIMDEHLQLTYVLPYIPFLGIIFCTTTEGVPAVIPSSFFTYQTEDIKYPVISNGLIWNVIIMASIASYLHNTSILRGEFMIRLKQLQKIGYQVTVVSYDDFTPESDSIKLNKLCQALSISSSLRSESLILS